MPVLRDLADEITKATGIPELEVRPFSKSSSNVTMLLRGGGRAFFAKIFTDADATKGDANLRYDREKEILSQAWPVQTPKLVYAADVQRVLVTNEVRGFPFKQFRDEGRTLEALGMMAEWLAGFHASVAVQPRDGSLWDDFIQYPEFRENPEFTALKPELEAYPLKEYVLTKGDCMAANFRFNRNGAVGLDFEGAAFRAKEYDLVALIQGLHALTGESIGDMATTIVQQYANIRGIEDQNATIEVVRKIVEATDY